jgi:hypothetical protein
MQQRQLRLGDILDDYCPRERRLTNHVIVAMVDADVKQTRCTTCDAEHEYKHAKVPRQRRKSESPAALYTQVAAGAPKRVAHERSNSESETDESTTPEPAPAHHDETAHASQSNGEDAVADRLPEPADDENEPGDAEREEGPVHRPLIRASLPRPEGQPPPTRPVPEFTIRQPGGRQNRFRPRHFRGGQQFQGNRSNGTQGGPMRDGMPRQSSGGRPQGSMPRRHGPPRKRSK